MENVVIQKAAKDFLKIIEKEQDALLAKYGPKGVLVSSDMLLISLLSTLLEIEGNGFVVDWEKICRSIPKMRDGMKGKGEVECLSFDEYVTPPPGLKWEKESGKTPETTLH